MPTTMKFDHVLQLKITLEGCRPPIWRRIVVPCTFTFWELHMAIQDAFGWDSSHLHVFDIVVPMTDEPFEVGIPYDDPIGEEPALPGWNIPVAGILTLIYRTCAYTYDLGDSWQHKVVLEKILPREPGLDGPLCTGGRRACPPEDCGGMAHYLFLLDALADPEHEGHEEAVELFGESFDAAAFDASQVRFSDPEQALRQIRLCR
jgi:hypothetical protein